jgi:hypothetical protein
MSLMSAPIVNKFWEGVQQFSPPNTANTANSADPNDEEFGCRHTKSEDQVTE